MGCQQSTANDANEQSENTDAAAAAGEAAAVVASPEKDATSPVDASFDNEPVWNPRGLPDVPIAETSSLSHIGANSQASGKPLKNENQDVVSDDAPFADRKDYAVCAVFDGHGQEGLKAAEYSHASMLRKLKMAIMQGEDPNEALHSSFMAVHKEMASTTDVDCKFSGATASVGMFAGTTLWFAHVGDSRGVLVCDRGGVAEPHELGRDHRPDDAREKERIEMAGGRVAAKTDANGNAFGPPRVYHAVGPLPGLMLSRSLGDVYAHDLGVSALPEITRVELTAQHKWLVIASDGVWDVMSNEDVCAIVWPCITCAEACQAILAEALDRWEARMSADNVGICVIKFS